VHLLDWRRERELALFELRSRLRLPIIAALMLLISGPDLTRFAAIDESLAASNIDSF
jgi:hypothetical protein